MRNATVILWMLLFIGVPTNAAEKEQEKAPSKPLKGKILQILPNGVLVQSLPASRVKDGETYYYAECWKSEEPLFLFCNSKGMIDGEVRQWIIVYSAGRFQYVSVIGATKTVRALTLIEKQHRESKGRK